MYRLLVCEDEEQIVSFIMKELEHEGYIADAAYDGGSGLKMFMENSYDLVLLDLMLPVKNGFEVLREIRKAGTIPVLMLTARKDVFDKVALLDAGADDYITKPFDTIELLARIRRALSRNKQETVSPVIVDGPGCRVMVNGNPVPLTKTEFEIFAFLYRNTGTVKSREQILQAVYGEYFCDSNSVDVNIKNIRRKMTASGMDSIIETVRGRGYVLRED